MYKSFFKKYLFLFIILVLVASCEGSDCIEADDFGEYDTDIINIDSRTTSCEWVDNDDYGEGDEAVRTCLEAPLSNPINFSSVNCRVTINGNCFTIKDYLGDSSSTSIANLSFSRINTQNECGVSTTQEKTNLLTSFYNESCINRCIQQCNQLVSSYEPNWIYNNVKEDKNGIGISITKSNKIQVQALGSLVLIDSENKTSEFRVTDKKIQVLNQSGNRLYLKRGAPLSLTGKWCRNHGSLATCPNTDDKRIGEFDTVPNIARRINFLRRGILFLETLPSGGSIDSNEVYSGPLQEPNFNAWKCLFSLDGSGNYTCESDFTGIASSYITENISLYGMENNFVKTSVGGSVIPTNVKEYITTNPITSNITCTTETSGGVRLRNCTNTPPPAFNIDMSGSGSANRALNSGYVLNKNGREINQIYPVKLAFKIIGNVPDKNQECTVSVAAPNIGTKTVKVYTNNNWHFLAEPEESSNRLILGSSNYHTLNILKDSSTYQNIEESKQYKITITFSSQTWKDENNIDVPCGEGMAVFLIPQNEILIEKSGFVSFRNLLDAYSSNCNPTDSNDFNTCLQSNYTLKFDIINPLYKFRTVDDATILSKNFYEYTQKKEATVNIGSAYNWSSEIFVRKGQILRFGEDNWFDIVSPGGGVKGFLIKNKIIKYNSSFTRKNNEGLFMKIDARPALLCKGVANEKVTNEDCRVQIETDGSKNCILEYTDVCTNEEDNKYCPFGCFPTSSSEIFYVKSGLSNCPITWESKDGYENMSHSKCQACKNYIDNENNRPSPEYNVTVIQCYDLENYAGAVVNLTDRSAEYGTPDKKGTVELYGDLTVKDFNLGAIKLKSIFENGNYGTFDGMRLDVTGRELDGTYSNFTYNSLDNLQFNSVRNLKFLLLDSSDFSFDSTSYQSNKGNYVLSFNSRETENNGSQLSIFLADKNWRSSDGYTPAVGNRFKAWIVKYNLAKQQGMNYGKLSADSPYEFNNNGVLVDRITKGEDIDMSKVSLGILDVPDHEFSNLRFFFKIVDKEEKVGCNNNKLNATEYITECKCEGDSDSTYTANCETKICSENIKIITRETPVCRDLYFNNTGTYVVRLRTEKNLSGTTDSASGIAASATGYIVKYIMAPILEILDGKSIGLATDNNSNLIPCSASDTIYKYGGDLPSNMVETTCSKTDPDYGVYCKTTTSRCGGTTGNPVDCFLPGADRNKFGNICTVENYPDYCLPTSNSRCSIYITPDRFNTSNKTFGNNCKPQDNGSEEGIVCYQNCSSLDTNLYRTRCKFMNDGRGFLQRFYQAVINDSAYQIILRLSFILMITFYGMYYLLGLAELTQSELLKRLIKISFIYLMVGRDGWYFYNKFFVTFFKGGVDYLVFAIAGAFDDSSSLAAAFVKNDFYDKSVLFSGVDKNLGLIFSDQVTYKIWGLMFVSFFGWLYVFLIYMSILTYIFAVANALLLYLTAQFFISMMLSFGPIFFVLLIFEKTKEMFDKWIKNLISFSLEQIFLLTCLSLFNTLVYNIIKFVLSYRVCWKPVWILNIPVLGRIELMSFWKATTVTSPTAAASAIPGLFQVLLIYLIADLMKSFIEFASDLGTSLGGGGSKSTDLSSDVKKAGQSFWNDKIEKPIKAGAKKVGTAVAGKLIGYKTEEQQEKDVEKLKTTHKYADDAVEKFKKEHAAELVYKSPDEVKKILKDVRSKAFASKAKESGLTDVDEDTSVASYSTSSFVGSELSKVKELAMEGLPKAARAIRDKIKGRGTSNGNGKVSGITNDTIADSMNAKKEKELNELDHAKESMSPKEYQDKRRGIIEGNDNRKVAAIAQNRLTDYLESKEGKMRVNNERSRLVSSGVSSQDADTMAMQNVKDEKRMEFENEERRKFGLPIRTSPVAPPAPPAPRPGTAAPAPSAASTPAPAAATPPPAPAPAPAPSAARPASAPTTPRAPMPPSTTPAPSRPGAPSSAPALARSAAAPTSAPILRPTPAPAAALSPRTTAVPAPSSPSPEDRSTPTPPPTGRGSTPPPAAEVAPTPPPAPAPSVAPSAEPAPAPAAVPGPRTVASVPPPAEVVAPGAPIPPPPAPRPDQGPRAVPPPRTTAVPPAAPSSPPPEDRSTLTPPPAGLEPTPPPHADGTVPPGWMQTSEGLRLIPSSPPAPPPPVLPIEEGEQ